MTKTEKLFQDAIKVSAEVVKMINEDDYDLEDKNIIDLNDKVSNIQCELLDLPMDFEIKNRKDYCKKLLGKDYFSDNRCWDYLNDVVYEIENDIGSMIKKSFKESLSERSEENEIIVSELQDTVEYFCGLFEEKGELKGNALKDLKNAVERLEVFNSIGSIYQWGVEVLNKCGIKYKGLKESKKSLKELIEYFVGDKTVKGFEVCMIEDGKKYYLSKLAKNVADSDWSSDYTYAKHWKDKSRAEEIVDELNSLNESLKESKSIKEGKNVKKSLEIIRRKLMELINDDTIQEEFNEVWENNGIYDSVDDMFEVSVHNVLNSLLKENTITIIPF